MEKSQENGTPTPENPKPDNVKSVVVKKFSAIERHRYTWQGKSDEWLFERLDNELKQKVEYINELSAEIDRLRDIIKNDLSINFDKRAKESLNKT